MINRIVKFNLKFAKLAISHKHKIQWMKTDLNSRGSEIGNFKFDLDGLHFQCSASQSAAHQIYSLPPCKQSMQYYRLKNSKKHLLIEKSHRN